MWLPRYPGTFCVFNLFFPVENGDLHTWNLHECSYLFISFKLLLTLSRKNILDRSSSPSLITTPLKYCKVPRYLWAISMKILSTQIYFWIVCFINTIYIPFLTNSIKYWVIIFSRKERFSLSNIVFLWRLNILRFSILWQHMSV